MDNAAVTDQAKQKVKTHYMVLCAVVGFMSVGLWIAVGCAIHFTEGTSAYWAGGVVCASMLFLCFLCSLRIYMNVEHFTTETKDKLKVMIDILTLVGALTTFSCIAGFAVTVRLGLSYCSSIFNDDECVNKDENDSIAPALIVGCVFSLFVTIGIQIVNASSRNELKLNQVKRVGQMTITLNQQQPYQNMNPGQGYNLGQFQTQPYPPTNPYPMPMHNTQGFQPTAPPPNYFSAASQPEYPPPQPTFPNQNGGFGNQNQYSGFN